MSQIEDLTREEAVVLSAIVQKLGPVPENQMDYTMAKIRAYLAHQKEQDENSTKS